MARRPGGAGRSGPAATPAAGEPQRRMQVHSLAVNPGVHRCRSIYLQLRRAPRPARNALAVARVVEDYDPELSAAERRAGAAGQGAIKRVGVVRHENDDEITVLAPQVVDQVQRRRLHARAHHLGRGLQERAHLSVAIGRAADRVSVDPQRRVVEECAAVHLGHVDLTLDPVGERVESADHVVPVHPHVEREVVACAGWNAHKWNAVRSRHCGHDRQRSVAAGHAERVCACRHGFPGQRGQVLARGEDDGLDLLLARPLGDPGARGLAAARPRVDEQYRPARRIGRLSAIT